MQIVGQYFKGDGVIWHCDSYDKRIGFWMTPIYGTRNLISKTERTNVSERAIGRTFHLTFLCRLTPTEQEAIDQHRLQTPYCNLNTIDISNESDHVCISIKRLVWAGEYYSEEIKINVPTIGM